MFARYRSHMHKGQVTVENRGGDRSLLIAHLALQSVSFYVIFSLFYRYECRDHHPVLGFFAAIYHFLWFYFGLLYICFGLSRLR